MSEEARTVVAVFGPTAVGKSELALALAPRLGAEIVCADALQLYRGLPTLTAQPAPAERAAVPHHLVGIWPLDHAGSLGEYAPLAHRAIDDCPQAIVAGGTGLYLRAALAELHLPPRPPQGLRSRLAALYDEGGADAAHALLASRDPAAAARVHPNDRRRVVRALELCELGSSLVPDVDRLWTSGLRRPALVAGLMRERADLRARIEARAAGMVRGGALDEVEQMLASGIEPSHTAARILGLAECIACLRGDLDREGCAAAIALRTWQYARRQLAWMRRIPGLVQLDAADGAEHNAARLSSLLA